MILSNPGTRSWYPSSICGPYHVWFCELGYPNLDIFEHQDGSWSIVEYYHTPMLPSEARWNYVLSGIKNTIPTAGFVKKYVHELDLRRREIWDEYAEKERLQDEEKARLDAHADDTATRAKDIIMQTPSLIERIGKNGLKEINLDKIVKHIPRHQFIGHKPPSF